MQFVIMPLYGPTKLFDASKALSKMIRIKYHTRSVYKDLNSWTVTEETPNGNRA